MEVEVSCHLFSSNPLKAKMGICRYLKEGIWSERRENCWLGDELAVLLIINNVKPSDKPGGFSEGCAAPARLWAVFGTIVEIQDTFPKCPFSKKLGEKRNIVILKQT